MAIRRGSVIGVAAVLLLACSEASTPAGSGGAAPAATSNAGAAKEPAVAPTPTPAPTTTPTEAPAAADPAALVREGREAYLGNCIACHNPDPKLDGALGPAIAGSPPALVEARVMRAEYPPGYKPKRDTRAMVAMPFLEKKIPAIAAYLDSLGSS